MILSRRSMLATLGVVVMPLPLSATPMEVEAAIEHLFGSRAMAEGSVALDLPALAETGNSVPLTVRVESPMTSDDRIQRLALFAEENPRPLICETRFGPMAAEAKLTTNIRLAASQRVICVAQHVNGALLIARRDVRVVVGACTTLPGRY